jgi:hypothetical protein
VFVPFNAVYSFLTIIPQPSIRRLGNAYLQHPRLLVQKSWNYKRSPKPPRKSSLFARQTITPLFSLSQAKFFHFLTPLFPFLCIFETFVSKILTLDNKNKLDLFCIVLT